jgi:hypothetical protein
MNDYVEQFKTDSHIWATTSVVVLINILLGMVVLYMYESDNFKMLLAQAMEAKVPHMNSTVMNSGLVLLVSLVVGYVTYTSMKNNSGYGTDLMDNLTHHYSDVKNIGLSLVPAVLAYVLGSGLVNKMSISSLTSSDVAGAAQGAAASTSERSINPNQRGGW